jgi:predicted RNA-binding protein with PIN domain
MPYLIDGHNLIPKVAGLSLRSIDDEEQLLRLLSEFSQGKKGRIEVFFDNAPAGHVRSQRIGKVTAHFVRQGRTADAAIATRLRQLAGDASNWTVVSSDRAVQAAAREMRAQVLKSEEFARLLAQDRVRGDQGQQAAEIPADEIDEWLELFKRSKPKK